MLPQNWTTANVKLQGAVGKEQQADGGDAEAASQRV